MKGILMNTTTLAGKNYKYNDITDGIITSSFPMDKFYGGRVTRFGKTSEGLFLCLEKNLDEVIDIFVEFDHLDELKSKTMRDVAEKVKAIIIANMPSDKRDAMEVELEIPDTATKKELKEYILKYARDVISDKQK